MNRYVHKTNEAGQYSWLSEVVDTVIRLFADHPNLLRGFIEYLPTCVEDIGLAKKIDDAVKKAEDKARARDLQQATAQQAAAWGEKVTAVDVDPWTGPRKVKAKPLFL